MKNMKILLTYILFIALGMLSPAQAQMVTSLEAFDVAENWIAVTVETRGSWGGAQTAHVSEIYDFQRDGRLLGYFFRVEPQGYIVVSLYRELTPVKVYSETSSIDPQSDCDATDLIKIMMENPLNALEKNQNPGFSIASYHDVDDPNSAPRFLWDVLMRDRKTAEPSVQSDPRIFSNYVGGDPPLLSSKWHSGNPYNAKCPGQPPCNTGPALSAAQIMRHWAWPPSYDWPYIANEYRPNSNQTGWEDEAGNSLSTRHLDAVATLCYEVGVASGTTYRSSPDSSTAPLVSTGENPQSLQSALQQDFLFTNTDFFRRGDHSTSVWFNMIKSDLNSNRPVLYSFPPPPGHSRPYLTVCDGWQQNGNSRQLHMRSSGWCVLEDLDQPEEKILIGLRPNCARGPGLVSGISGSSIFAVYFDEDACTLPGNTVEYVGCECQFLPGVRVGTTSCGDATQVGAPIEFSAVSGSSARCRLFSIKGTSTASIKITGGGSLTLSNKGSVRFF